MAMGGWGMELVAISLLDSDTSSLVTTLCSCLSQATVTSQFTPAVFRLHSTKIRAKVSRFRVSQNLVCFCFCSDNGEVSHKLIAKVESFKRMVCGMFMEPIWPHICDFIENEAHKQMREQHHHRGLDSNRPQGEERMHDS